MTHAKLYDDATGLQPFGGLFTEEKPGIGTAIQRTIYVRNTGPHNLDVKLSATGAHAEEVTLSVKDLKLKSGEIQQLKATWTPSTRFKEEHFNARIHIDEEYVV